MGNVVLVRKRDYKNIVIPDDVLKTVAVLVIVKDQSPNLVYLNICIK